MQAPIAAIQAFVQEMLKPSAVAGQANTSAPNAMAAPFSEVFAQAARQIDRLRTDADSKVRGLMTGDGTDIHTALIATQKADMAFELALATRNKAIAAYQQLMNTQF